MSESLLFIPDISGFTEFVQNTEVEHSQHVIAELLEVLIDANTQELQLAEVEGDALFFYKEGEIPSLEKLLAQVETMFTAFYSHLKLLEKNRICPCHACSTAHNLELKIIVHGGVLQFITVQENRKPFGPQVIEAHRLMKNSVTSDNYVLLSKDISDLIALSPAYQSKLYNFQKGENKYDGKTVPYVYAVIDNAELKLKPFSQAKKITFDHPPSLTFEKKYPVSASQLLEIITNYAYRHHWVAGVDKFEFNENEVTRLGSEHVCVINNKHLNFITVTKENEPGSVVYGELTTEVPIMDEFYQFYSVRPVSNTQCLLKVEVYWKVKSPIKRLILHAQGKKSIRKNTMNAMEGLFRFVEKETLLVED